MLFNIIILAFLAIALFGLGKAYFLLINPNADRRDMVKALSLRISFSLGAFILVMLGSYFFR